MIKKETIGANIKKAMVAKGLNQLALANAVGVAPSKISNYVLGKNFPSIETLAAIAQELETSVDCLLGIEKKDDSKELCTLGDILRALFAIDEAVGVGVKIFSPAGAYIPELTLGKKRGDKSNYYYLYNAIEEWGKLKKLDVDRTLVEDTILPAWKAQIVQRLDDYDLNGQIVDSADGELPF